MKHIYKLAEILLKLLKLKNIIAETKFLELFLEKYKIITRKNIEKIELSYRENNFLKFSDYYFSYITVIQDIEKVLSFLKIDTDKILDLFPFLQHEEDYYKYHYENYFLRILTIPDLIGKMGNAIFDLKIKEDNCNGYKFKTVYSSLQTHKENITLKIEEILKFTEDLKRDRHLKIHIGKNNPEKLSYLNQQIMFLNVFNSEYDLEFRQQFYDNIKNEIDNLEKQLTALLKLCSQFYFLIYNEI